MHSANAQPFFFRKRNSKLHGFVHSIYIDKFHAGEKKFNFEISQQLL